MANPLSPFPKFSPIGGLPWAVSGLLLPSNTTAILAVEPKKPPARPKLVSVPKIVPSNVVQFPVRARIDDTPAV